MTIVSTPVEALPGGATSASVNVTLNGTGVILAYVKTNTVVPSGCSSNVSGALTQLEQVSSSSVYSTLYGINAAAAGAHTITATCSLADLIYLVAITISGVQIDVHTSRDNNFLGTGTDVNTSGSVTISSAADIVFGLFHKLSLGAQPSVGTTTLLGSTATALSTPSGVASFLWEYYQPTSQGAINPTSGTTVSGDFAGITVALTPIAPAFVML
jgi:hypothetical protein